MMKLLLSTFLSTVLLFMSSCGTSNLQKGVDAYNEGSYQLALETITPLANDGDTNAQYLLGTLHYRGQGVSKNMMEAIKWFTLAAERGNANAQVSLGTMHLTGNGTPQNHPEAHRWMKLAAEQGNALGQAKLGLLYMGGKGIYQDIVLAHMWLSLAIDNGEEDAVPVRDEIEGRMTAYQIESARRLTLKWRPIAKTHPQQSWHSIFRWRVNF